MSDFQQLINKTARNFIDTLSQEDKDYIVSGQNFIDMVGRAIRNHGNLWHDSPLTERWRTDPSSRDIRDGVDYSEDHPDQISHIILERVIQLLKADGILINVGSVQPESYK